MKKILIGLLACAACVSFTACSEQRSKEHSKEHSKEQAKEAAASKEAKMEQPAKKGNVEEKKAS